MDSFQPKNRTLIPVIDLLDGEVVQAVAGQRSTYQPFQSSVFPFETPVELARKLTDLFQPQWIYVADLNAIQSIGHNRHWLNQMKGIPVTLLVDSGFHCWEDYLELNSQVSPELDWMPVFGSETLESPDALACQLAEREPGGMASCFVSVDLKKHQVLRSSPSAGEKPGASGRDFFEDLMLLGFQRFIILDLDSVGTGHSDFSDWNLTGLHSMEVFAGGGIRDWNTIADLKRRGFAGALVASAIHNGNIQPE